MSDPGFHISGNPSAQEQEARGGAIDLFRRCPIPDAELLPNLGLFLNRPALTRILFMHELYRRIVDVHGVVMEFGPRWGQNLALFQSFRGMYEPYNHTRKIIGFDTFEGFPSVGRQDGNHEVIAPGAYGVTEGYEGFLEELLGIQEKESPLGHMRKFELVKGDVTRTLPRYLEDNPETVVALAYFDMDLYEPTLAALTTIRDRLVKGSVIGLDEVNVAHYPGETIAVMEALGLENVRLRRSPTDSLPSYFVWGD